MYIYGVLKFPQFESLDLLLFSLFGTIAQMNGFFYDREIAIFQIYFKPRYFSISSRLSCFTVVAFWKLGPFWKQQLVVLEEDQFFDFSWGQGGIDQEFYAAVQSFYDYLLSMGRDCYFAPKAINDKMMLKIYRPSKAQMGFSFFLAYVGEQVESYFGLNNYICRNLYNFLTLSIFGFIIIEDEKIISQGFQN